MIRLRWGHEGLKFIKTVPLKFKEHVQLVVPMYTTGSSQLLAEYDVLFFSIEFLVDTNLLAY